MDFLNLSVAKILKLNKDKLQDDIKEMKYGFTPVTNQNVRGSVSNDLLKLEKERYELQQSSAIFEKE